MVEVRLHGPLAAAFGKRWDFDILTPHEAVAALECARPGFQDKIRELSEMGLHFKVKTRTHDYVDDDLGLPIAGGRLDIIPITAGASARTRAVIGTALIVVGSAVQGPWGAAMRTVGTILLAGAITEMLTPVPKQETEESKRRQSWTISGPTNTVDQGAAVPVIYGEVLTGGYPISAGLAASEISDLSTYAPSVDFGGEVDYYFYANGTQAVTVRVRLSASPFAISEPLTYLWSYSGFTGATARRLIGNTLASVVLELDYPSSSALQSDSGGLGCTVTGVTPATAGSSSPTAANASKFQNITVKVDRTIFTGS